MSPRGKSRRNETVDNINEMVSRFAGTVGEIFDDPDVRENAKSFAKSIVDSAAKVVDSKVEDKEMKARFRNVGKAAQDLGTSLEKHFETEKKKTTASSKS